jgi:hypothetical protein
MSKEADGMGEAISEKRFEIRDPSEYIVSKRQFDGPG